MSRAERNEKRREKNLVGRRSTRSAEENERRLAGARVVRRPIRHDISVHIAGADPLTTLPRLRLARRSTGRMRADASSSRGPYWRPRSARSVSLPGIMPVCQDKTPVYFSCALAGASVSQEAAAGSSIILPCRSPLGRPDRTRKKTESRAHCFSVFAQCARFRSGIIARFFALVIPMFRVFIRRFFFSIPWARFIRDTSKIL